VKSSKTIPHGKTEMMFYASFTGAVDAIVTTQPTHIAIKNESSSVRTIPINTILGYTEHPNDDGCYLIKNIKDLANFMSTGPKDDGISIVQNRTDPSYEHPSYHRSASGLAKSSTDPTQVLENGIHICTSNQMFANQLHELVNEFQDRWAEPRIVDLPSDQFMPIDLIENWETHKVASKPYPPSSEDRQVLDEAFDKLHGTKGLMEWVTHPTPFGAPVFVVWRIVHGKRKPRPVIDLRPLNRVTVNDAYPMPLHEDIIRALRGKSCISVVDGASFFYQFRVKPEHRERFTIVSPRGQEVSNVCLMGFKNTPAYIQRTMDYQLRPFKDFARCFIDDIVIFSNPRQDYLKHLRLLLDHFRSIDLRLAPKKSYLGFTSVELLPPSHQSERLINRAPD
jgi:hypothetical protein